MTVSAVVVAAGSGRRLGASVPKAFVQVGGTSLVDLSVAALCSHPDVGRVVVVVPDGYQSRVRLLADTETVVGGAERTDSVRAGLSLVGKDCDLVLVHDAARPFVPPEVISRVVSAVRAGADAAIPVLPVADTIKRVDADDVVIGTVARAELRAVQTPQAFTRDILTRAHAGSGFSVTDDAALVEALGGRVVTVPGAPESFKITTPFDLQVATALFADRPVPPS